MAYSEGRKKTFTPILLDEESDGESPQSASVEVSDAPLSTQTTSERAALDQITRSTSSALDHMSFLVTGQLKELSRDDATLLIRRHGGDVKGSVSGKLMYLIVGTEPGEAKLTKAKELRVKNLSEVEFYRLVKKQLDRLPLIKKEPVKLADTTPGPSATLDNALWSDKYAPKKPADLCYPTLYNKIKQWLLAFQAGGEKKGMLVSGPPGIGKTTSVYVAAKELKYDVIELNTSNQRSGSVLHDQLDHIILNRGLFNKNNLLLLDEVDGCEKGGIGEIVKFLKKTKIPIICTCNDHWDQKLKPLLPHVEDLKAQRAPYTAMSTFLQKILEKEHVQIPLVSLQEMVMANGHDFRSLLNNIQLWSRQDKSASIENETFQGLNKLARKDLDINLFDTAKAFFDPHARDSFSERYVRLRNLYYNSDLIPLFIQENYLNYTPSLKASQLLSTADVIQSKIFVDQQWQLSNAHFLHASLYPHKLCRGKFQSFSPFSNQYESGVKFPSALGKSSTIRKNVTTAQEILSQGTFRSFNLKSFATSVSPIVLQRLVQPFLSQQEKDVSHRSFLAFMREYRLIRSDIDCLNEIVSINSKLDFKYSFDTLPTGVKSKITRDCGGANLIERQRKAQISGNGDEDSNGTSKPSAKKPSASKRKATPSAEKKAKTARKKA